MHLASDYSHPYKDVGGRLAQCRVRIYLSEEEQDAPVVICSELPSNPGGSITNSVEAIAAGVIQANKLPAPLVWIEHRPEESTNGGEETFELVVFSSYEVIERAPYLGETRTWIGDATWKPLDRTTWRHWWVGRCSSRSRGEASGLLAGTSDIAAWKNTTPGGFPEQMPHLANSILGWTVH
jgi:hypothetical protein